MLDHFGKNIEHFQCPSCEGDLQAHRDSRISCKKCANEYLIESGIPLLFESDEEYPGNITTKIKKFYEENPFPNYDDLDDIASLTRKAKKSVFGKLLEEQIPRNARVLEVGCGTGQLINFLSVSNRNNFGVDMSRNSLQLGHIFKERNSLDNVGFYQMNIFKPIFKPETFNYVICNGVLHHTKDPYLGLSGLVKLLKKDGYFVLGLYNKYGRLLTDLRRWLINNFGESMKMLDPNIKGNEMGKIKKNVWYLDQYKNPHESKHTIGEVLGWFEDFGLEFINCIPKLDITEPFSEDELIFAKTEDLNMTNMVLSQARQILTGGQEGGLFVMIGKKK